MNPLVRTYSIRNSEKIPVCKIKFGQAVRKLRAIKVDQSDAPMTRGEVVKGGSWLFNAIASRPSNHTPTNFHLSLPLLSYL